MYAHVNTTPRINPRVVYCTHERPSWFLHVSSIQGFPTKRLLCTSVCERYFGCDETASLPYHLYMTVIWDIPHNFHHKSVGLRKWRLAVRDLMFILLCIGTDAQLLLLRFYYNRTFNYYANREMNNAKNSSAYLQFHAQNEYITTKLWRQKLCRVKSKTCFLM